MITKGTSSIAKKVLIGAGLAAGAAVAAYLLSSSKTRKKAELKIKGWMRDMRSEIADRAKAVQELTQQRYEAIIDDVKPKYKALKDVSGGELEIFAQELKAHWNKISKTLAKANKAKKK